MNRLKTTDNGGFPLELDDLRWMDDGYRDAFKMLCNVLGDNFIISGFEVDGFGTNSTTWAAGIVVLNGELFRVDASTISQNTVGGFGYVEIVTTNDPAGLETFENNVQYNTYEIRKATLVGYTSVQTDKVSYLSLATSEQLINNKILAYPHNFTRRQSFAQGTSTSLISGNSNIHLNILEGNAFNVDISAASVPVTNFTSLAHNGTWLMLKFVGNSNAAITIAEGTGYIKTPGAKPYVFKTGETAIFVQYDNKWWLTSVPDYATETKKGIAEVADIFEVNAGISDSCFVTPLKLANALGVLHVEGGIRLKRKTVDIEGWNMNADGAIEVDHEVADFTTIRNVSAMIRNDANTFLFMINFATNYAGTLAGSVGGITPTKVILLRTHGGFFDDVDFQSVAFSRGHITVEYVG